MELLLVRHAIAEQRDTLRWPDDGLRPLSARGMRRFKRACIGIHQLLSQPELVVCSPLLRARQTARLLLKHAGWPAAEIVAELAPGNRPDALLAALATHRVNSLAVIGHEPELGRLLACCVMPTATRAAVEFRKGAVACIGFDDRVMAGRGRLRWLLSPRILRSAAR